MLYCRTFDGHDYLEEFESRLGEDDDDDMPDKLAKARRDRKKFLDTFSDEHLIQIHSVVHFLVEMALICQLRQTINCQSRFYDYY